MRGFLEITSLSLDLKNESNIHFRKKKQIVNKGQA